LSRKIWSLETWVDRSTGDFPVSHAYTEKMIRTILWTLAFSALLACASAAAERGRLAAGTWGGPHIRLDVADDATAAVEFDCAHGTITEPIVPDGTGAFQAAGRYVRERPGPVRKEDTGEGVPAVYAGKVDGKSLTLTITLTGFDQELGPFELIQGKTTRLTKCL
jgi:hypothetical protein